MSDLDQIFAESVKSTLGKDARLSAPPASAPSASADPYDAIFAESAHAVLGKSTPSVEPSPAAPERTMSQELGHQLGLTLRAGVNGVASLPAMLANAAIVAPVNAALATYDNLRAPTVSELVTPNGSAEPVKKPGYRLPDQAKAVDDFLTRIGVAVPENDTERIVQDAASAVAGAGSFAKAGDLVAKGAAGVTKKVGEMMAAGPGAQAVAGATGAGAGGIVRENGGSEGEQLAANLIGTVVPGAASTTGGAAGRAILRGGEAGRQKMLDTIAQFKGAADTAPTMGQATQSRTARAAESLLSKLPGSAGVMVRKAEGQNEALANNVQGLADSLALGASATSGGEAITRGVQAFKEAFKAKQKQLYDALDQYIPQGERIGVNRTKAALAALNEDIEGAPALSQWFKNAKIQGIEGAFDSDTGGAAAVLTRPGVQQEVDKLRAGLTEQSQNAAAANERHFGTLRQQADEAKVANENWRAQLLQEAEAAQARNAQRSTLGMNNFEPVQTPAEIKALPDKFHVMGEKDIASILPPNTVRTQADIEREVNDYLIGQVDNKLPYESMKKLRSLVGAEISNNSLVADVPRSKWKALYAALSQDLKETADKAGPQATERWKLANDYTAGGIKKLEELDSVVGRDTPEKIFSAATAGTAEGDTTIRRVMEALPEAERRQVAASVLQRLGRANPGQQNELGNAFSSNTFLTNLSKLSPAARATIFGNTGVEGIGDRVKLMAGMASNIRDGSKVFANPSGTAQVLNLRDMVAGTAGALATGNPLTAAGVAAVPVLNYGAARAMTAPSIVNWAAKRTELAPSLAPSALGIMARVRQGETQKERQQRAMEELAGASNVDEAVQAATRAVGH